MWAQYAMTTRRQAFSGWSQTAADGRRLTKDGRALSVLIVEDDHLVAMAFVLAVEEHGGQVIGVAEGPGAALGLVVGHRPDVVVMDIRLKNGADGLSTADAMRALYQTPIVLCTGHADAETAERIRQFGGTGCLFKPVRPTELRDAILRACGP